MKFALWIGNLFLKILPLSSEHHELYISIKLAIMDYIGLIMPGNLILHLENPNIVNEPVIKAVSKYLNSGRIQISNGDYEVILRDIPTNSFVYLDPPYHPISESSNFTGYVQGGWSERDQLRLRDVCNRLNSNGIKFLLSNSASNFIKEIYAEYNIHVVQASRAINSDSSKRGQVDEFLISNYE